MKLKLLFSIGLLCSNFLIVCSQPNSNIVKMLENLGFFIPSTNELQDLAERNQAARAQALLQVIDSDALSARPTHSSVRQAGLPQHDSSDDLLPFMALQGSQEQPKGLCARIAACLACLC